MANAAMQESSRVSCRILVMTASPERAEITVPQVPQFGTGLLGSTRGTKKEPAEGRGGPAAVVPLHPHDRGPYLQRVAAMLQGQQELGDGIVSRAAKAAQQEFLRPPLRPQLCGNTAARADECSPSTANRPPFSAA
jgi:hypothetical protein